MKISWPTEQPRIAIFRALQLGDMLCAVPALRALRLAWPAAAITLIGLPWAAAFVNRYAELIDDLMVFPGAVGFPEQTETDAYLPDFYARACARRFDLAIQLHGSGGVANDILFRLGAGDHAGFLQPGESDRGRGFMPWPDTLPEPERYTALMRFLGLPVQDCNLSFALQAEDIETCAELFALHRLDYRRLICVHPGARYPSRRWPSERFALVAEQLADEGWQIAVTGSNGEKPVTDAVLSAMRHVAVDLVGMTTLGTLAALLAQARLLICNDTGVSHLAAGVQARSVVVASGSDTRRWAPINDDLHRVLAHHPPCRPCGYVECPFDHSCALQVSVSEVLFAARHQLLYGSLPAAPVCASPGHFRAYSAGA